MLVEPIADERLKPQPILVNANKYVELDPVDQNLQQKKAELKCRGGIGLRTNRSGGIDFKKREGGAIASQESWFGR